ncbi:MAG: TonB-dependent receptor [Bacteroidetes bacterium]|nr:MAG: TonB-dependent receptor [Bacteroidota bacterium]
MKHLLWITLLTLLQSSVYSFGQEKYNLSGTIQDQRTGESIYSAKVSVQGKNIGVLSNTDGYYTLSLPPGKYRIVVRAYSYDSIQQVIELDQDRVVDFRLKSKLKELDEVQATAEKEGQLKNSKIGQIDLDINKIKTLPAFMGEIDIVKAIQLLPGVNSASEGGQGFYVRGGGPDQNLVMLDDAHVYNASHLFGFFSIFNADAVKNVNLIKGGIPANYGGRLSSVLEVGMNEGNNQRFGVKGGLGIISSRLSLEGPIVKNKSSFLLSARRTYIDVLMKGLIPSESPFAGSGYFFHDFNFKTNFRLGKKDKLFLSAYYGKDQFTYNNKRDDFIVRMPWGNGIAAIRWNHIITPKLFVNVIANYTNYEFKFDSEQENFRFELLSGIKDLGGKTQFTYHVNTRQKLKWGAEYLFHTFIPTSVSASQEDVVFDTGLAQKIKSHESGIYITDEIDFSDNFRVNAGLRYSTYQFVGPFTRYINGSVNGQDSTIVYGRNDLIRFFHGLEPRLTSRYILNSKSSLKAGFTYNYQYVHLTSLSAVSLPTDIWFPATDLAPPQKAWQASLGYFRNFLKDLYESSVEVYYKSMQNLVEYKNGALPQDNVNDNTDNLLLTGKGWSYGAEFFLKKTRGKLTGWIGYTWSKTERYFPELQMDPFPAKYDRRHDLSVVASYQLNKRWTFGASFVYATGNTLTLPSSWYLQGQDLLFHYGERNATRMADYHRFDLAATWYAKDTKKVYDPVKNEHIEVPKRYKSSWSFSVYNMYNRANPYFLYIDNDGDLLEGDFKISVKQVTLFPIIPSITWNFEF